MTAPPDHEIFVDASNVHGRWSAHRAPILTVASGERVRIRNLPDVTWGTGQHDDEIVRPTLAGRDISREGGPGMCCPIAVRGAQPGMVLEVRFDAIVPGAWGWTWTGASHFTGDWRARIGMEGSRVVRWTIDNERGVATSEAGFEVTIRPFLGIAKRLNLQFVLGWTPEDFVKSLHSLAEGEIDGSPLITGEVGLDGVPQAFADLSDPGEHVKILVRPDL